MLFEIAVVWTWLVFIVEVAAFSDALNFKEKIIRISKKFNYTYTPFASVIIAFKGIDPGLEENLAAILKQDYPKKEYIFVLDNFKDPTYKILKKFKSKTVKIAIARSVKNCPGKLAALITGSKMANGEVLVFGDSDIRPGKNWLSELVRPLKDSSVGAVTAYRWYFPTDKNFASHLRSAWSSIGYWMMLGKHTFVWGGSFGLTRKNFDKFKITERWKTAIADDVEISRACKKFGCKIQFVPTAVVGTFENCTWSQLKEFSNRQTWLSKLGSKKGARIGLFIYSTLNFMFLTGVLFLAAGFWKPYLLTPGLVIVLLQLIAPVRAYLKQKALEFAVPHYKPYFRQNRLRSLVTEFLVRPLGNYNLIKAKYMKGIEWRGRKYSADI
ncbi:MAG TPA: glycosyltransferase family 2 protein [archaeon]|nr:glycosyltransferase family 2 protein [archaeon]